MIPLDGGNPALRGVLDNPALDLSQANGPYYGYQGVGVNPPDGKVWCWTLICLLVASWFTGFVLLFVLPDKNKSSISQGSRLNCIVTALHAGRTLVSGLGQF